MVFGANNIALTWVRLRRVLIGLRRSTFVTESFFLGAIEIGLGGFLLRCAWLHDSPRFKSMPSSIRTTRRHVCTLTDAIFSRSVAEPPRAAPELRPLSRRGGLSRLGRITNMARNTARPTKPQPDAASSRGACPDVLHQREGERDHRQYVNEASHGVGIDQAEQPQHE